MTTDFVSGLPGGCKLTTSREEVDRGERYWIDGRFCGRQGPSIIIDFDSIIQSLALA